MVEIEEEDVLNEADMMKMMGFSDFNSTKVLQLFYSSIVECCGS